MGRPRARAPRPEGEHEVRRRPRATRRRHSSCPTRLSSTSWWRTFAAAGAALDLPQPLTGPVSVEVTFTLPLPPSVRPATRTWPTTHNSNDLDKMLRLVLDALTGPVFLDDSQVVEVTARKAYPHTPAPDLTPTCGALIRIWSTEA